MKRSSLHLWHSRRVCATGKHRRSGAILIFTMMALLVVSMIGASLLRTSIASMRQIHREQQRLQTGWVAEAGCQRAIYRFQTEANYAGETWKIPAEQLQSRSNASVLITVTPDSKPESGQIISVVAEFPEDAVQKVRISKQVSVPLLKQEAR